MSESRRDPPPLSSTPPPTQQRGSMEEPLPLQFDLSHTMTDHAPLAIFFVDAEGRVTFANPAAERLFGWTESELLGRQMHDVVHHHHPDGRAFPVAECTHACAMHAGHPLEDVETVFFHKDGSPIAVLCSRNATQVSQGMPQGSVVVVQDISGHKRVERELLAADRRKDEFLAELAHELRTPLAAIQAAVEISGGEAEAAWARGVIVRQTQQLSRLVEDLLDISRISRGKIILKRELLDATKVIEAAVDAVQRTIQERRHRFTVTMSQTPLPVNADPVRLQQIVANLLTNAAKYTDDGGRISLTAELKDEKVVISVCDNGVGIAPEMLARLYDPYMQVESSLGRARGGLGIGLPLVHEIVRLHEGTIEAHSRGMGWGSEFIVRLPVARELTTAQTALPLGREPEQTAWKFGRRVLLVEDDLDTAEGLARLLRRGGHDVEVAASGAQALGMAQDLRFDVVVCDIGLPDMDGYVVAKRLREFGQEPPPLLIALSGFSDERHRLRAREAGFDRQFIKPIDVSLLRDLLAEAPKR